MLVPETRPSLILRVRDPNDADAWNQFATLYRPVILRLARRKGIQAADAEDLAQQVLLSVAGAIERWQPDQQRARGKKGVRNRFLAFVAFLVGER
jgi:RNA polymerase sigma-70 factor (ECF subfamily)